VTTKRSNFNKYIYFYVNERQKRVLGTYIILGERRKMMMMMIRMEKQLYDIITEMKKRGGQYLNLI